MSGAAIDAMRPNPAAAPVPVPRRCVGYSSGPIAYSAPHAPRLKKLKAQPAAMICHSALLAPYSPAANAEPTRNVASVLRRPHFSMRNAETVYPGSCASVMISVNVKLLTSVNPCSCRIDGIQMNAP